ncbi:PREDICTED: F-actin-uncapping protein LRRC16A isoform X2 [Nicrophorus vespilloides]|uniref:F-actin-uncapping protein LRRC16A isoform X2 n=1 Tax=Nicrophorus vespilloides TaxID=110193 RepID=A0ABM1M1H6_NICVS|nr:PREDICTED: F-actin-uncapping protein LRRC16A isoform X2 [Nicrophorus vespilloides]
MSTRSQLTKDLNESVKTLLGKQVKILFKNVVRLETKGDKTENRVLVFSPCRILLLTAKVPTRIDCHFHYLEIQALESKRGNQLSITVNEKTYSFLTGDDSTSSQEVDSMISALATAIRNIFPTVSLHYIIRKIEVIPSSRLQVLRDIEAVGSNVREVGPCGGFSTQYACMCDYFNMPYREEVAWDVDNIYVSLNTRELCLKDFDHLDQKDLIPIISALEYNTWFTRLRVNHVKLSHDVMEKVLNVLRKSLSLEELYLDNLTLKADFINKLTGNIKSNRIIPLHTIDLSNNLIEDKGAINLGACIGELNKGLVHLNLSHCSLSPKGINQLSNLLNNRSSLYNTLTYLNLSGNSLKDDITHLHTFLGHPNALSYIDISATDIILESVFGSLVKGCTTNLVHLNVSRNPFSSKKSKEAPIAFKQFFSTTLNLKYLNMAHCKLPQEALKNLLLGLACNEFTKEITLDLSNNSLGAQGAHVIESCIHGVRCISSLDISENNMDVDLAAVVIAISKNKSLKHLSMGRNMTNMKAKHVSTVMDAVVQIIQDEECTLQTLCIPDCRLKADLHNFFSALGNNKCLESIDITGNMIGDSGARLLAKALQINSKLKSILYDKNNITLQGYFDIAYALESNKTVQHMPFPIYDITPCMKANADRADNVMRKIQELLNRNVSPRKNNMKKMKVLQPGFLLSSKQHAVDRLVNQTNDVIKNLGSDSVATNNDINHASGVMQDADNCKRLFGILQEVAQQKDEVHPVKVKLQQVSADVHSCVNEYLQTITEKMLKSSKELCPYVLNDNHVMQDIKRDCKNKKQIPLEFITNSIKHQAGTDIMNKLGELNLMIASYVSEQITDEVFETLMRGYKVLLGDNTGIRIDSPPRRSRLSSSDSSRHGASDISITDSSHQSDHSPLATPHLSIKRKSLHGRKLRPKSVVDSVEGLSADDIPSLLPSLPRNSEEEDSVTELPNATHQLQHLVKGRPRRVKTRAPTRPLLRPSDVIDTGIPDLKEGLDTFFRPGSVTPTSDDCGGFSSLPPMCDGSGESPSRDYSSPALSEGRKTPKLARNSPQLKGLMIPAPRSRSTDNLEKYSPAAARRVDTASPLTRRATGDSLLSQESIDTDVDVSPCGSITRTITTDDGKSKTGPAIAPKPRPWSMVNAEHHKSGDTLLSDGSSPAQSTGNTPDSGDALDGGGSESSSIDRKIVKDLKAKKAGLLQSYFPVREDFRFLSRNKGIVVDRGRLLSTGSIERRRDSNFNCKGTEDAHFGR